MSIWPKKSQINAFVAGISNQHSWHSSAIPEYLTMHHIKKETHFKINNDTAKSKKSNLSENNSNNSFQSHIQKQFKYMLC